VKQVKIFRFQISDFRLSLSLYDIGW